MFIVFSLTCVQSIEGKNKVKQKVKGVQLSWHTFPCGAVIKLNNSQTFLSLIEDNLHDVQLLLQEKPDNCRITDFLSKQKHTTNKRYYSLLIAYYSGGCKP